MAETVVCRGCADEPLRFETCRECIQQVIAVRRETLTTRLDVVAATGNSMLREAVADNRHTSPATLIKLAADPAAHVRAGVARNPRTRADTLRRLRLDDNYLVRMLAQGRDVA